MASITLTIDDAQLARWKAAYAVDTNVELKNALIKQAKAVVVHYETAQAEATAAATLNAAKDSYSSTIATAQATSEAEISVS